MGTGSVGRNLFRQSGSLRQSTVGLKPDLQLDFLRPVPQERTTQVVKAPLLASIRLAAESHSPQPAASRSNELWFAVHLPLLALEVFTPAGDSRRSSRAPVAVIGISGSQQHIVACNAAATALGIMAGMGINAAYALTGRLQIHERQAAAEQGLLERLAAWAGRFTPRVSLEPPDTLLLEVKSSRKLFGGLAALGGQIEAGVRDQGLTPWLSLSPTPRAALWFARSGEKVNIGTVAALPGALARLPIAVARWPESSVTLLDSMGVHMLGDCLRLPRDGFACRLGPALLLELDQAVDRNPEVRRDFRPQRRFKAARDFEEEIEQGARLTQYLDGLIDDLVEFLEARQTGVQALKLLLLHREQPPTVQILRFASLATQREHFVTVLGEQLARLHLPAPVRGAKLRSGPLLLNAPVSKRFFFAASAADSRQVSRLFEKLSARLGAGAFYALAVFDDHRPEHAWGRSVVASGAERGKTGKAALPAARATKARPTWLLTQPQPLEQQAGWPYCDGRLELLRGPERIEGGWWTGEDVTRDYYVGCSSSGVRLWIYRDRCPPHEWFLHGIFG